MRKVHNARHAKDEREPASDQKERTGIGQTREDLRNEKFHKTPPLQKEDEQRIGSGHREKATRAN